MIGQGGNACIPRGFIFFFLCNFPPSLSCIRCQWLTLKRSKLSCKSGGKRHPSAGWSEGQSTVRRGGLYSRLLYVPAMDGRTVRGPSGNGGLSWSLATPAPMLRGERWMVLCWFSLFFGGKTVLEESLALSLVVLIYPQGHDKHQQPSHNQQKKVTMTTQGRIESLIPAIQPTTAEPTHPSKHCPLGQPTGRI